jgi:hypothetical protein
MYFDFISLSDYRAKVLILFIPRLDARVIIQVLLGAAVKARQTLPEQFLVGLTFPRAAHNKKL